MKRFKTVKTALGCVTIPLYSLSSKIPSLEFAKPNYQSTDNVHKFKRKQPPDIWALGRGNTVTLGSSG